MRWCLLQCVTQQISGSNFGAFSKFEGNHACCSALQCAATCCSMLHGPFSAQILVRFPNSKVEIPCSTVLEHRKFSTELSFCPVLNFGAFPEIRRSFQHSFDTVTHCNTLQRTATQYNTIQHNATQCNTLQHNATYCNTLQHKDPTSVVLPLTLPHTATHCNTLQHTATHCNTLQHTATHCNTMQHSDPSSLVLPLPPRAKMGDTPCALTQVRCRGVAVCCSVL